MSLPKASRTIVVGHNGAGKSTLLKIIAGKSLVKTPLRVLGFHPFYQQNTNIAYLGTEWANSLVTKSDVLVSRLLHSLGAEKVKERVNVLIKILGVDVNWHMHQISDGQRRRVQIVLGLMNNWDLLLLDEVTVDLDVLARRSLLDFLSYESSTRNATIVYATHIFDGLGDWATNIVHLSQGQIIHNVKIDENFTELIELRRIPSDNSPLLRLVESWIKKDYKSVESGENTRLRELSDNMKEFGDKYYNYWSDK